MRMVSFRRESHSHESFAASRCEQSGARRKEPPAIRPGRRVRVHDLRPGSERVPAAGNDCRQRRLQCLDGGGARRRCGIRVDEPICASARARRERVRAVIGYGNVGEKSEPFGATWIRRPLMVSSASPVPTDPNRKVESASGFCVPAGGYTRSVSSGPSWRGIGGSSSISSGARSIWAVGAQAASTRPETVEGRRGIDAACLPRDIS